MKKVTVLTGAGISAESGLSTFRGSNGLWEGYDIEDVASITGWEKDPETVLNFYNLRREQIVNAEPNAGHKAIADLEDYFKVSVITQNVDDLHEKAGSSNVTHLHGKLTEARSSDDPNLVEEIGSKNINLGNKASDGSQLRPNIVWFGEPVPMIDKAAEEISTTDILIVAGTSLVVYPAAGLIHYAPEKAPKYIVDPTIPDSVDLRGWEYIEKTATKGLPELKKKLIEKFTE